MRTHFDDIYEREMLGWVEKRIRGLSDEAAKGWIDQALTQHLPKDRVRALKDVPCYVIWWTLLHSKHRTFGELRGDGQWLSRLSHFGADELQMNVNARLFWHAAQYMRHGYRTFEISPGLSELLRHTELQGLVGADLHLPYQSLYMHVPAQSGLRVWNDMTEWHRLAGVYLSVEDGHDTGPGAIEGLEGLPGRTLRAMVVGEWQMREVIPGLQMPDDALLYWSVPLVDDWPLDKCIRMHKDHARDYRGRLPASYAKMTTEWDDIFTWLVNVVMYATSGQARAELRHFDPRAEATRRRMNKAKNPKRRKAHASELSGMDQRRYTILGRGIPLLSECTAKGTGTPLDHRVLVSGHWRNQAVGPRWSERRRILIEPHWRGPEDADECSTTHKLV